MHEALENLLSLEKQTRLVSHSFLLSLFGLSASLFTIFIHFIVHFYSHLWSVLDSKDKLEEGVENTNSLLQSSYSANNIFQGSRSRINQSTTGHNNQDMFRTKRVGTPERACPYFDEEKKPIETGCNQDGSRSFHVCRSDAR